MGGSTDLAGRTADLRDAARCLVDDAAATDNQRSAATQLLALLDAIRGPIG